MKKLKLVRLNGWKNVKTRMIVEIIRADKAAYINCLGRSDISLKSAMTASFIRAKEHGETNPLSAMAKKYKSLWAVDWDSISREFRNTNEVVTCNYGHRFIGDDDCHQCLMHGPLNRVANF